MTGKPLRTFSAPTATIWSSRATLAEVPFFFHRLSNICASIIPKMTMLCCLRRPPTVSEARWTRILWRFVRSDNQNNFALRKLKNVDCIFTFCCCLLLYNFYSSKINYWLILQFIGGGKYGFRYFFCLFNLPPEIEM